MTPLGVTIVCWVFIVLLLMRKVYRLEDRVQELEELFNPPRRGRLAFPKEDQIIAIRGQTHRSRKPPMAD